MGFIKDNIKKQVKPQWNELKRTTKSVFGIHKSTGELIAESAFPHYLIAKHTVQTGQDHYDICDTSMQLIYSITGTFWLGHHHLIVKKKGERIGAIRKKLIAIPDIIEGQSERHMCLIYQNNNETNCIEAYKESKKQIYKIHKHGWKISYCPDNDSYILRHQKKVIAQLNEASNNEYVIGYNDIDKEVDITLLAMSFFQINNAIMNK